MKTLEQIVYNHLRDNLLGRKRVAQHKVVAFILTERHPVLANVPPKVMTEIVEECQTFNRYFRKVMNAENWWSESDKKTKKQVVQAKELELGVAEIGFDAMSKDFLENI